MRHSIHIMFGQEMEDSLNRLTDYVYKYGEKEAASHYYPVLWQTETTDNAEQLLKLAEMIVGIAGIFDVPGAKTSKHIIHFIREIKHLYPEVPSCPVTNSEPYIQNFFDQMYQKNVTIEHPGDGAGMCLCLHLPLFDLQSWKYAKIIIEQINKINFDYHIDLLGYTTDLSYLFLSDEKNKEFPLHKNEYQQNAYTILKEATDLRNENKLSHVVIMQNRNEKKLSLNLDQASFIRIIGEFTLLYLENYRYFFENTLDQNKYEIATFGLAVLNFDKYQFVDYLLSRAFIHRMEQEGVNQTKVDINQIIEFVNNLLKDDCHLIDNLQKEIRFSLGEKPKTEDEVIVQLDNLVSEKFKQLTDHLLNFLKDDKLNIPEKQARLAQLLDQDDHLFENYAEIAETTTFTDFDREAFGYFIQANHRLRCPDEPLLSQKQLTTLESYSLNFGCADIDTPLSEIKGLKAKVKSQTTFLTRKKDELEKLKTNLLQIEEREKVLTENGYCFRGTNYKLLHVQEEPLEETYSSDNRPILKSVDLRSFFPPIKNQGSQGACTAFAFTSVYEYILKNKYQDNTDLSEAFVYRNARKRRGNAEEDNGCSLYDAVASLMEEGICKEALCPYQADIPNPVISAEAYNDGKTRLVIKAMNVKRYENDLKAALSEGYPIIVSLLVFDSMTKIKGFISYPEQDERKDQQSAHAMVLCGYDDDRRIFIIRNSWGEDFGEKGYAYIPYSYVCDPELMRMACIITEISAGVSVNSTERVAANFDVHENSLQYAITKNLIKEIEHDIACDNQRLKDIEAAYTLLKTDLEKKENRDRIYKGTNLRLKYEQESIEEEIANLEQVHRAQLESLGCKYRKKIVRWLAGFAGSVVLIILLLTYGYVLPAEIQIVAGGLLILVAGSLLAIGCYFYYRGKKEQKQSCQDYKAAMCRKKARIAERQKELEFLRIEVSLHGRVIDKLFNLKNQLSTKYNGIRILLQNLTTWYEEEKRKIDRLINLEKPIPFLPLLSQKQLDTYYKSIQNEEIAPELFRFFLEKNTWSEESIRQAKDDSIKQTIYDLLEKIDDFDISDLLTKQGSYPYLDEHLDLPLLLSQLDEKSSLFVDKRFFINTDNERAKTVCVPMDNQEDLKIWKKIFAKSSNISPSPIAIKSRYKIAILQRANILISEKDIPRL